MIQHYVQFFILCREKITQCGVPHTYRRVSYSMNLLGSCPHRNYRCIVIHRHSGILKVRIRHFCILILSSDRIPAACLSLRLCRMSRVVFVCIHCVESRQNKRIVPPVSIHLKGRGSLKKRKTTNENEKLIKEETGIV